jgi:NAD(P)H-flavin reductase
VKTVSSVSVPQYPATVIARRSLSPQVELIRLRLDADAALSWRPGQYTEITIPAAPQLSVPYSIASIPDPLAPNELELALPRIGGEELIQRLMLGARVLISQARGEFIWEPSTGPALFIGIGTGVAPLRAMLQARLRESGRERVVLLFGARSEADLLFREELEGLGRAHPHFSFEPTLSRPGRDWSGRTGRVQQHLSTLLAGIAGSTSAYLCGNRDMVADCAARLQALGVPVERVRSEAH